MVNIEGFGREDAAALIAEAVVAEPEVHYRLQMDGDRVVARLLFHDPDITEWDGLPLIPIEPDEYVDAGFTRTDEGWEPPAEVVRPAKVDPVDALADLLVAKGVLTRTDIEGTVEGR